MPLSAATYTLLEINSEYNLGLHLRNEQSPLSTCSWPSRGLNCECGRYFKSNNGVDSEGQVHPNRQELQGLLVLGNNTELLEILR
jgi:hypothetical protein